MPRTLAQVEEVLATLRREADNAEACVKLRSARVHAKVAGSANELLASI